MEAPFLSRREKWICALEGIRADPFEYRVRGVECMDLSHPMVSSLIPEYSQLTLDHTGPMARSVKDVALLLEVIAGPDGYDPRQCGLTSKPYLKYLRTDLNDLKVGIVQEGFDWEELSESDVDEMVRDSALAILVHRTIKQCDERNEFDAYDLH